MDLLKRSKKEFIEAQDSAEYSLKNSALTWEWLIIHGEKSVIASVCVFFMKLPKNIEVYTMGEYVELAKICVGQF